jgi:hypothetical protein
MHTLRIFRYINASDLLKISLDCDAQFIPKNETDSHFDGCVLQKALAASQYHTSPQIQISQLTKNQELQ